MTLGVSLLFPSFHGVRGPVNEEMLSTYSTPYIVYMHDIILCQDLRLTHTYSQYTAIWTSFWRLLIVEVMTLIYIRLGSLTLSLTTLAFSQLATYVLAEPILICKRSMMKFAF